MSERLDGWMDGWMNERFVCISPNISELTILP